LTVRDFESVRQQRFPHSPAPVRGMHCQIQHFEFVRRDAPCDQKASDLAVEFGDRAIVLKRLPRGRPYRLAPDAV
jgi:hypothetical protein